MLPTEITLGKNFVAGPKQGVLLVQEETYDTLGV